MEQAIIVYLDLQGVPLKPDWLPISRWQSLTIKTVYFVNLLGHSYGYVLRSLTRIQSSSLSDKDGQLAIAKFPRQDDELDVIAWEAVALRLANKAGIKVPEWRLELVGRRNILLSRRFDRKKNIRIPFLSAMSILGAQDNEMHSYLEIADAIRQMSTVPKEDLEDLWRRIVFNVLISNVDDHLRNHAFLYSGTSG